MFENKKITCSKLKIFNDNINPVCEFLRLKSMLILYLFIVGFFQQLKAEELKYIFEGITNDKGLTHNTVFDICQDKKGFMWFATDGGLNRFDGQNIRQYYAQENNRSLPSNSASCMVYTSDFKMFIGTIDGLALYLPETDDFSQILYNNMPLDNIIALQQGLGSELLISTTKKGAFIYNYETNKFTTLTFLKERIFGMCVDKQGTYWAYSRYTLFRFNKNHQLIAKYQVSPTLFNSAISYVRSDSRGILWIGTFEKGLFTFNFQSKKITPVISSNGVEMYYIRTIEEGENPNEYWVGTEKGLYVINVQTGYFEHYTQSFDGHRKTINDNAIYKIFRNKQNVFFVGTYFGGVNIAKTRHIGFNAIYPEDKPGYLHGKALSSIVKAPDGKLWIATEDAGIAIFDKGNNSFKHLLANSKNPTTISTNNVHALLLDNKVCWAGHFMGGLSKIDIQTGKTKHFLQNPFDASSLNNNFVFALHFLSPDSILVGTIAGVDLFDKKTEKFSRFRENELNDCYVYDIFNAPDGKVWICTYNNGIFILDRTHRGLMTHFQAGDNSGLSGNSIISHLVDSKKRIWIGTRGAGLCLYNHSKQSFTVFNSNGILSDNVVYGILEDNKGMLWVSSNKGISQLNLSDSTSIHFNYKQGINGNQYNYKSYYKDNDGTMYFGSVTGLTWFQPDNIITATEKQDVYFTNLLIFNEIIRPNSTGLLKKQIDFTEKVELKYNQNSFTFEFGVIDYSASDIAYQYYLVGFDKSWSPITEKSQANYTNISTGDYVFHVRAVNKINNIVSAERILQIGISPPFWKSLPAYLVYLILLSGIMYYFYKNYRKRQQEKLTLAIEKIEKDNLNLLHQHKLNFFTYISHEFKTPLSIIIASVEMLFRERHTQDANEISEIQHSIKRSATRLLTLVNQLMEFRKIETDHAVMSISKGSIVDFVNQVISIYRPLLKERNIELNLQMSYEQTEIYVDFDKLEKILTNLFTNAVKYTPSGGNIGFQFKVTNEEIEFSVKDSGKGLQEAQKEKIFEVFYNEKFSNNFVESSGIGLSLTAALVKLMKGLIWVESEPDKVCMFNVRIPLMQGNEMTELHVKNVSSLEIPDLVDVSYKNNQEEENSLISEKIFSIVIAEDNKDLLLLLQNNFRHKYRVKSFENGKDAWDYINEKIPDVVITDIMMPIMSGTELCFKIKTEVNLCHIPVVMLTAKTAPDARIEGLQMGADTYIPKPFSLEELNIQISNILNTRTVLKKRLKELAQYEHFTIPTTNHEQAFVEKVLAIIQENLEEENLDVQFLTDRLNISRSSLHTKMKTLMNMSISEFVNTVRINEAKKLITDNNFSMAEIAYKVGYNDSAYFNRIFKKSTGKTPGEFRKDSNISN